MGSDKKTDNKTTERIKKQVEKDLKTPTKNFAKLLKAKRKEQELSMMSLYKLSGVANSTINDIEKERYLPHLEVMLKLGYALGLNYKDIVSEIYQKEITTPVECKESVLHMIKLQLKVLDCSTSEINEILDFIKFKLKDKFSIGDIYK